MEITLDWKGSVIRRELNPIHAKPETREDSDLKESELEDVSIGRTM